MDTVVFIFSIVLHIALGLFALLSFIIAIAFKIYVRNEHSIQTKHEESMLHVANKPNFDNTVTNKSIIFAHAVMAMVAAYLSYPPLAIIALCIACSNHYALVWAQEARKIGNPKTRVNR